MSRRFEDGGPSLIGVRIDDSPATGQTVRDPTLIRTASCRPWERAGAGRWTPERSL